MDRHTVIAKGGKIIMSDRDSGYKLILDTIGNTRLGDIYFEIPNFSNFDIPQGSSIPMTARRFHEYLENYWKLKNEEDQYIEVGPGYSEFIQELITRGLKTKPILIEPANLEATKRLLDFANKKLLETKYQPRINRLLKTHEFLTDDSKVRLYNCTLGHALENYGPEIKNTADVVIDYCGPGVYSETEMITADINALRGKEGPEINDILRRNVISLEKELLKSDGVLLINRDKFRKSN